MLRDSVRRAPGFLNHAAHDSNQGGATMDRTKHFPSSGMPEISGRSARPIVSGRPLPVAVPQLLVLVFEDPNIIELWNLTIQRHPDYAAVKRYDSSHFSSAARNSNEVGGIM